MKKYDLMWWLAIVFLVFFLALLMRECIKNVTLHDLENAKVLNITTITK